MDNRLRELRARHRLSQLELAKKAGVRRETIVHLENGKFNPSIILAHKLAKIFDTTIEELFIFEGD